MVAAVRRGTASTNALAKLRLAGLVKGRREGTFVYYSDTSTLGCAEPIRRWCLAT